MEYLLLTGILLNCVLITVNRFFKHIPDKIYLPCMLIGIACMLTGIILMKS